MIIGVTGSFGTGKSTVAKMLAEHDFALIDADKVYEALLKTNTQLKAKLKTAFGKDILKGAQIDKKKLRAVVFSNKKNIKKLNDITHPVIVKAIEDELLKLRAEKYKRVTTMMKKLKQDVALKKEQVVVDAVIDAPLLFEAGADTLVDKVMVVVCSKAAMEKRVLAKKKYSKDEIKAFIAAQMPEAKKKKKADVVIDNSKDESHTHEQVSEALHQLR